MQEDNIVNYPNSIDTRIALVEKSIGHLNETLVRLEHFLEKRFDSIDNKFDGIDKKFDSVDSKFNEIRKEMKSDFRWILTISIGLFASLGGFMAHGFHWI